MTTTIPEANTDSRDALRARIESSERRNAERTLADQARDAATSAADYTRANPLTVIGGALATGLVIGLLTRPGRRVAGRAFHNASDAISNAGNTVKNAATGSRSGFGRSFGDTVLAYATTMIDEVMDAARTGQDRVSDLGDTAATQAKRFGSNASYAAESAKDSTRSLARNTQTAAADAFRDLKRKTNW
ncbi:hypothetical protein [Erythrobacter sp. R86502]|uniref:hypothetical protein n=1 Tax=Erythrobacter sp. R86502 TaxID=3093846 RepID=UPI0036D36208